jgi:superfamily I DNA/RNA helicase
MGPKKMYGYENFDFLRSGKLKGGKKPGKWRETTLVWTNKKPRFSMYLENYLTLAQCNEIRGQFWAFRGREARQEFLEEFEKVWMTIMARLGVHSRMSNQDVQERISELKDADTRKNINKLWNLLISADQSYADVRPASAFTIHSSQGQTFDYVALYVPEGSSISKRALYTAVSRARKRVFIITPNDSAAE